MYDISKSVYNLNGSQLLSQSHKQIIKDEFYTRWKTCQNEMIEGEDLNIITSSRQPIIFALKKIMQTTGILEEFNINYNEHFDRFLQELNLKCPTCGRKLEKYTKVGKYIGDDEFWHSFHNLIKVSTCSFNNSCEVSDRQNNTYSEADSVKIALEQHRNQQKLSEYISARQVKQKNGGKKDLIGRKRKDFSQSSHSEADLFEIAKKNPLALRQNFKSDRIDNVNNNYYNPHLQITTDNAPVIACIDDNKTVQIQVKKTLEWAGYKVLSIMDPGSSITTLVRHKPKLILMDINMPYFDGYELCEMLRKSRKLKNIPIAMFSAQDGIVDRFRAKMCGTIGFLSKPVAPLELIDFVNNIVPITPESLLKIYSQQLKSDR